MQEIWKDIPNYEGLYQVSNIGNVKILNANGDKILKKSISSGYYCVGLKGKLYYVHKLVAFAFIPNPNNLPLINHKDGNKQNNNINNLEWCTYSHNTKEAYRLGLIKKNKMMKVLQVRLPDNIIEWLDKMAKKEGVAISTMLRLFLDREMYREEIEKQFDKKRGNK